MKSKEELLSKKLSIQRDSEIFHKSYDEEMRFYNSIKNGDFETLKETYKPFTNEGLGKLSSNPLRNLKYHLIVMISLITRFCIEGGMNQETAYTLSDIYINQIDISHSQEELYVIHRDVVFDFAERMYNLKKRKGYSKIVVKTRNFISDHINEKISLNDLSKNINVNKSYLCELFKKETGSTILEYITKTKIENAKEMLVFSDNTCLEISSYFSFSSLSHFISTFKKLEGKTPNEFRKEHFRNYLENDRTV